MTSVYEGTAVYVIRACVVKDELLYLYNTMNLTIESSMNISTHQCILPLSLSGTGRGRAIVGDVQKQHYFQELKCFYNDTSILLYVLSWQMGGTTPCSPLAP